MSPASGSVAVAVMVGDWFVKAVTDAGASIIGGLTAVARVAASLDRAAALADASRSAARVVMGVAAPRRIRLVRRIFRQSSRMFVNPLGSPVELRGCRLAYRRAMRFTLNVNGTSGRLSGGCNDRVSWGTLVRYGRARMGRNRRTMCGGTARNADDLLRIVTRGESPRAS